MHAANLKIRRETVASAPRNLRVLVALAILCPALAFAATIRNTASVNYTNDSGQSVTLQSNTVVTEVLPIPQQAQIEFRRYDPGAPGGSLMPFGGGQCRVVGGSFEPLPPVSDNSGNPVDPEASETDAAEGYYVGDPVVITVTDANRNTDPALRDYLDVDVTTTTGDAETLRVLETAADSGVFAGVIQGFAMPPAATPYDCGLSLADGATITAMYTDADFPLDVSTVVAAAYDGVPAGATVLRLEQAVSRQQVEVGDFLQYTLVLRNIHDGPAFSARIHDTLPAGVRYRAGSLRVGAPALVAAAEASGLALQSTTVKRDPLFGSDGRNFTIPVGNLEPGASVTATFVAEVGAGSRGPELVNFAVAASAGGIRSNETDTVVRMRDALLTSRFTVVGRVTAGGCGSGDAVEGIPGIRLVMEDGTFVTTDAQGAYHFAGVRPGTHVVQLDVATLPETLELVPCLRNTRFAGSAYSQFVEGQGGSLWRADFRLRRGASPTGEVGVTLEAETRGERVRYTATLDAGAVAVQHLRAMVMLPEGASYVAGSAKLDDKAVADPEVTGNIAVFDLGDQGARWRKQLQLEVEPGACPAEGHLTKAMLLFEAGGEGSRTPTTSLALPCGAPPGKASSERSAISVTAADGESAASPFFEQTRARRSILSDIAADGGGDVDWFNGQDPGRDWLFPPVGRSPRSSSTRVVLKFLPGDTPRLKINGEPVSPLKFDGTAKGAGGTMAIGTWRGVPLLEGDNLLQAEIVDSSGKVVASLERTVFYANSVARAELVPEQSILVADGIHAPVIAVRMLDRHGNPVRNGVGGDYTIAPPYVPYTDVRAQQARQLAGAEGAEPTWHIEGDDGIAYIELAPTGAAGSFKLGFDFGPDPSHPLHQEVEGWLKSAPRDWIVVGFAKGSVGYATLEDNMQALPPEEDGTGVRADGKVSLYAKGRVLGKWMLTMAYDSGKETGRLQRQGLLSTIDPQKYYTLYGDGSQQGYDAASASKLYLKLERDQFYALFGDFQTGLGDGELSRYQRTLNGVKVEYHGPLVQFTGFAANTAQAYARDEIRGDGTSGLYRLSHPGILMNSERVRIETRDRYHSEQIIDSRDLLRHIDYDIDYDNGTLFFREPIASRDFDFNPIFIVVDYETRGGAEEYLSAGGRVGVRLLEGRLEAGLSYIRDEDMQARSSLAGLDVRYRPTDRDEIRAEVATSRSEPGAGDASEDGGAGGSAWLVEWEHRGERFNLRTYARRNGPGFGLGQQNASESGTMKVGVQGQWRVNEQFSLRGEAYRQENLGSGAVRDAARADVVYRVGEWNTQAGLQWARDTGADGKVAESRQVTLGVSRAFLDKRLALGAKADLSLGGRNDSVDFPTRFTLDAAYAVTPEFKILAAQELTDGEDRDTSTTRFGFETSPWRNARLTSTLNQSRISEYGPRTFALFGLNQRFLVGEHWGFDVAVDSSRAFNESGNAPLVIDPAQPIQEGGIRDGGALTQDFVAISGGATYRAELWSWNVRAEGRQGETDRYGFTSSFLRQARDGVALSASMQAFSQRNADGSSGLLANAQLSWAYRPLGSRWSMLDKLEFRLDEITRGTGGEPIIGQDTLAATGDARSRRLINNLVLNYASDAWDGDDTRGVLALDQRSQLSLYYGAKYVLDSFGSEDYAGFTDIIGAEWRFDLTPKIDVGLRASVIHSWSQKNFAFAVGPSVGFTPFTNTWVSVGYNIRGFHDRDFEDAHHTAQGPYIVFRMKFDQDTFGLDHADTMQSGQQ